jgi:catechol 2,3-dioxygenase-like lactoylglutathione lyase family enzyme
MPITEFDHYTVRSADHDASWRFYEQVLGLTVRKREGTPVPAFKVSIGEREVVHVFQAAPEMEAIFAKLPPAEQLQGWNTGRLHHVEFWATGLDEVRRRLESEGVTFSERTLPDKHQVAMYDPDGIAVNLNFPLAEVGR